MNLTEAARRVLFHHARLIAIFVALGVAGAIAIATSSPPRYTATSRVVLDTRLRDAPEGVTAVADGARAIVTSRDFVEDALRETGASRDPVRIVRESLRVQALGVSGAVEISVTDVNPSVASALANALSRGLVERWPEASGQSGDALAALQQKIDSVGAEMDQLEEQIARLNATIASTADGATDPVLTARRDAREGERDELAQLRLVLQTQLGSILVEQSTGIEARVLDQAVPPSQPNPDNMVPMTALGALLGLMLGIGGASVIEALRPTVVGSDSIADELDVPVLGRLPKKRPKGHEQGQRLGLQMRLAAQSAKANTVELVSLEPSFELSRVQQAVRSTSKEWGGHQEQEDLVIRPFGSERTSANGSSNGEVSRALVAVVPHVIKRSQLREVRDLQSVTKWPLIGVVTYVPKRRWRLASRSSKREGDS